MPILQPAPRPKPGGLSELIEYLLKVVDKTKITKSSKMIIKGNLRRANSELKKY